MEKFVFFLLFLGAALISILFIWNVVKKTLHEIKEKKLEQTKEWIDSFTEEFISLKKRGHTEEIKKISMKWSSLFVDKYDDMEISLFEHHHPILRRIHGALIKYMNFIDVQFYGTTELSFLDHELLLKERNRSIEEISEIICSECS